MRTHVRRSSRSALAATCALATPILIGAALPAAAQTVPAAGVPGGGAPLVSLDVRDAQLTGVVLMLRQQTGTDIVIEPGPEKGYSPVSLAITDKPIDQVLRAVAAAAGARVVEESGIYYIRPKGSEATPGTPSLLPESVVVAAAPAPVPAAPAPVSNPRGRTEYRKMTLNFLIPSQVVTLLREGRDWIMEDPELLRLRHMQMHIQGAPNSNVPNGVEGGGPAAGSGFGAGRVDTPGNNSLVAGRAAQGFNQGNQGNIGGNNQGNGQGNAVDLLPEGVDQILALDADGSLLVKATPEGFDELQAIIRQLDVAPRQVLVKAEFVSVTLSDIDAFGIEWNIKFSNNTNLNLPSGANTPAGSLGLAYASGNAVARLRMDVTKSTTNIIQAPIVTATNLTPAQVFINQQIPYFTTVQNVTNNQVVNNQQTQFIPVQNGLQVVPRINGDNSITMRVEPILTAVDFITGPDGVPAPITTQSGVSAYRRIANGETMVLGGFVNRQETRATNETPILSKLPLIGWLFRSRERRVSGTETLIFLTPTIIEDRPAGALGAAGGGAAGTGAGTSF